MFYQYSILEKGNPGKAVWGLLDREGKWASMAMIFAGWWKCSNPSVIDIYVSGLHLIFKFYMYTLKEWMFINYVFII